MLSILKETTSYVRFHGTGLGVSILLILIGAGLSLSSVNVLATGQSAGALTLQRAIGQLGDNHLTLARESAQRQLEASGEAGVDALIGSLRSSNPILRRNSVEMLGYMASPRSTAALNDALENDMDAGVRSQAAWSLSGLNTVAVAPMLERASMLDIDASVRQAAVDARVALCTNLAVMAGQDARQARDFAIAPSEQRIVYLAVSDQILVSRDGGRLWSPSGTTPSPVMTLAVSPTNPKIIYAGTESRGLAKSTDGGSTWALANSGLGEQDGTPFSATAIAFDPENPSHMFLAKGVWIGTSQARLFPKALLETRDAAETWQPVSTSPADDAFSRLMISGDLVYGLAGNRVVTTKY
jgi:hypothetical protein